MSWTSVYRLALHLLPAQLRRKHGLAMEDLFGREIGRAREQGRLHTGLTGAAGVWDLVRRGAYEYGRPGPDVGGEPFEDRSQAQWSMDARVRSLASANFGDPQMPQPTNAQLLRRHAASFTFAYLTLTATLLARYVIGHLPSLRAQGASPGAIADVVVLAVPFMSALTIPMAVLIAVLWEFSRLAKDGTLAAARRERGGVRRLIAPVLGAAVGISVLALVVTAEVVPRANTRLSAVLSGRPAAPNDRTMTFGELREAARTAAGPEAGARTAAYQVEFQKKLALPAACVLMALAGMAIALRVPGGGVVLVIGVSVVVFAAYYVVLMTGEDLADRLVVSPFVGMWGANALLLGIALLANWRRRAPVV